MKRFMLCLLVFLLALTPSMAEDNMESLRVVGVSGDEFIWRFQADNGQNIYFTSREAEPFIQYQDINFDGIPDLTILTTRGASNFFYKLFVFSNNHYSPVKLMGYEGDAVNFQLHSKEKLLSTYANNGYAGALFESTLYQWDGTDLYPVRKATSEEYKEASLNNATYTLITHLDQLHVTFRDYPENEYEGILYHEETLLLSSITAEIMEQWEALLWQGLPEAPSTILSKYRGYSVFEQNGKHGLLNPHGDEVLPAQYYIPLDRLDEAQENPCIAVYQATKPCLPPLSDLDYALENGLMQGGFFCTTNGFFSGCQWKDFNCAENYVSVCNAEDQYALLNAENGNVLLDYRYAWVWPGEIADGWVYVWLFPTENNDEAEFIPAYAHLDGRCLIAPEGTHFSEEPEAIQNQQVLLYHEDTGEAVWTDIASLL